MQYEKHYTAILKYIDIFLHHYIVTQNQQVWNKVVSGNVAYLVIYT